MYQIRKRTNKSGLGRFSVILEVWANGKRKVVSGGTYDSNQEAIRVGETLLSLYENDTNKLVAFHGSRILQDWVEEWLNGISVKQSTAITYRWRMENWVLPYLGNIQLKNLSIQSIDKWINGPSLNHLCRRSKQSALDVLRNCLKKAVQYSMIPLNFAQGVSLEWTRAQKKGEKQSKKIKTWNYEEVQKLLDASVDLPVEPIIILGLLAGLRPGEAMVVRWSDIDWVSGTVSVSRTYSRTADYQSTVEFSTKTGEVRRARLTSDGIMRLMRIQENRQNINLESPIYLNHSSKYSTLWRQLKSLCERVKVTSLSPHCLRHTHASLLLENGATLAAVAKQLGHSNPTVTASVYWHLINVEDDTISGVMDRALGKSIIEEGSWIQTNS